MILFSFFIHLNFKIMKIKFPFAILLISVLFFAACGNSKTNKTKKDSAVEAVTDVKKTAETPQIAGDYVKGGHDESYVMNVVLNADNSTFTAKFAKIDGMIPPGEMFDEVVDYKILEDFKVDAATLNFTSKTVNGTFLMVEGVFMAKIDGMTNEAGDQLILEKASDEE